VISERVRGVREDALYKSTFSPLPSLVMATCALNLTFLALLTSEIKMVSQIGAQNPY